MPRRDEIREAISDGPLCERVFVLPTFRCNLACAYCLTESSSTCAGREMSADAVLDVARQARELGFTGLGITGGEPLLLPWLPDVVAEIAAELPVLVLSNGLLLGGELLTRVRRLWADLPIMVQLSLDRPERAANDAWRDAGAFGRVVRRVPKLVQAGLRVRLAATVHEQPESEWQALRELARGLGVRPGDLFQRPVVRRGRAVEAGCGLPVHRWSLAPELTVTREGAFWNPFGATVTGGELDTDMLLTTVTDPLEVAAGVMVDWIRERPQGDDAVLGIR